MNVNDLIASFSLTICCIGHLLGTSCIAFTLQVFRKVFHLAHNYFFFRYESLHYCFVHVHDFDSNELLSGVWFIAIPIFVVLR